MKRVTKMEICLVLEDIGEEKLDAELELRLIGEGFEESFDMDYIACRLQAATELLSATMTATRCPPDPQACAVDDPSYN